MTDFKKGTKIRLTNKDTVVVKCKIGEGGQGSVYKVDYMGKNYALKWYSSYYLKRLNSNCKRFFNNIVNNAKERSPSSKFLWMKAVAVTGKRSNGFGYLMDLRPANYKEFTKFIKAKEFFASTEVVIAAALNVVEAFQVLHRKGHTYQDLSPGNFFIDKNTGDVLICDNDNVISQGESFGIGGTPGYMAPEIILGKSKPSTSSDLFSLSVILFQLFFLSHPLEGSNSCKYPCLTQQREREIYAVHPVFVYSKTDKSNAPVRGTCSNLMRLWPIYPEYLHEAFQRAFSEECLKDETKRLTETEWKNILYRLQDDAVKCPYCGEINFASDNPSGIFNCTVCGKKNIIRCIIEVNDYKIAMCKGKNLTEYHTLHGERNKIVGSFVESKKTPGVFGIKNDSTVIWGVTYPDKPITSYAPGKVVTAIPGTVIEIGNTEIKIVSAIENK